MMKAKAKPEKGQGSADGAVDAWLAKAGRLRAVTGARSADTAANLIREGRAALAEIEEAHRAAKAPVLAAGREIDLRRRLAIEPIEAMIRSLNGLLGSWQAEMEARERAAREAEAEALRLEAEREAARAPSSPSPPALVALEIAEEAAQAPAAELVRARLPGGLVSTREVWSLESWDRATLDLEALREFLPDVAVEAAIRAAIRAGARTLAGAKITRSLAPVVR